MYKLCMLPYPGGNLYKLGDSDTLRLQSVNPVDTADLNADYILEHNINIFFIAKSWLRNSDDSRYKEITPADYRALSIIITSEGHHCHHRIFFTPCLLSVSVSPSLTHPLKQLLIFISSYHLLFWAFTSPHTTKKIKLHNSLQQFNGIPVLCLCKVLKKDRPPAPHKIRMKANIGQSDDSQVYRTTKLTQGMISRNVMSWLNNTPLSLHIICKVNDWSYPWVNV